MGPGTDGSYILMYSRGTDSRDAVEEGGICGVLDSRTDGNPQHITFSNGERRTAQRLRTEMGP
jgi:hypothetical protein